ncbi:hypothetical protein, partial [Escherichia coli]
PVYLFLRKFSLQDSRGGSALLSCIKQAREDVLTLRHLQLLHQNR